MGAIFGEALQKCKFECEYQCEALQICKFECKYQCEALQICQCKCKYACKNVKLCKNAKLCNLKLRIRYFAAVYVQLHFLLFFKVKFTCVFISPSNWNVASSDQQNLEISSSVLVSSHVHIASLRGKSSSLSFCTLIIIKSFSQHFRYAF